MPSLFQQAILFSHFLPPTVKQHHHICPIACTHWAPLVTVQQGFCVIGRSELATWAGSLTNQLKLSKPPQNSQRQIKAALSSHGTQGGLKFVINYYYYFLLFTLSFFCRFHFECEFVARLLRFRSEIQSWNRFTFVGERTVGWSNILCWWLFVCFFISSLNTPPGTKVKLLGTVEIKNGLLLLDDSKISVLGGVVEHMVEKWELQRVSVHFFCNGDSPALIKTLKGMNCCCFFLCFFAFAFPLIVFVLSHWVMSPVSLQSLAKHSRSNIGAEGGPPPFVPFGQVRTMEVTSLSGQACSVARQSRTLWTAIFNLGQTEMCPVSCHCSRAAAGIVMSEQSTCYRHM